MKHLTATPSLIFLVSLLGCVEDSEPTEDTSSTSNTGIESTGTGPTSEADSDTSTNTTGDGDDDDSTSTTGDGDGDGDGVSATCGNGIVEDTEVCDDGNRETEFPPYDGTECMDVCTMVLADCGNGIVDPGEQCDDGNGDSMDVCTTSCTVNDKAVHDPCTRDSNDLTNVTAGAITGCENVPDVTGLETGCLKNGTLNLGALGRIDLYAPEGECQLIATKCVSGIGCALADDIGNFDVVTPSSCPTGTTFVEFPVTQTGTTVESRVCNKICESDADCRWNAYDDNRSVPGEYRCQDNPLGGPRFCDENRNRESLGG